MRARAHTFRAAADCARKMGVRASLVSMRMGRIHSYGAARYTKTTTNNTERRRFAVVAGAKDKNVDSINRPPVRPGSARGGPRQGTRRTVGPRARCAGTRSPTPKIGGSGG